MLLLAYMQTNKVLTAELLMNNRFGFELNTCAFVVLHYLEV